MLSDLLRNSSTYVPSISHLSELVAEYFDPRISETPSATSVPGMTQYGTATTTTNKQGNKQTCPPRYKEPEVHYQGGEKQFA